MRSVEGHLSAKLTLEEVRSGADGPAHPVRPEFNPELDGVRGVAMVGIFLFHCAPKTDIVFIDAFTGSLWPAIGVFFALSGFLITRNLLDDQRNA